MEIVILCVDTENTQVAHPASIPVPKSHQVQTGHMLQHATSNIVEDFGIFHSLTPVKDFIQNPSLDCFLPPKTTKQ